ncbi:MAG: serine hydrolase [Bacteroidia bacterium]|nr:serine hydrolase [Bacteroidia bacterium]
MRIIVKGILALVILVAVLATIAKLTGNEYLIKGVRLTYLKGTNTANIYDGKDFETRKVSKSSKAYEIPSAQNQIEIPKKLEAEFLETQTASTILIQNDTILWEKYYNEHDRGARGNSFSAVKTMVCYLVQIAIQEGKIPNWEAKAKDYLPWLKGSFSGDVSLYNLATMSSGLDWEEAYTDPFCITAKAYYGEDVTALMKSVGIVSKPGAGFRYQSGNTQLLGIILSELYKQPLSQILEEKLWHPIGAEADATWSLDHKGGMELSYCCLNAVTRDFAKMGLLSLNQGHINGKQLLDSAYIRTATVGHFSPDYGIGYWMGTINNTPYHLFQGHLGQFIAIIPSKNAVFVRTGNQKKEAGHIPSCIQSYLRTILELI